MSNLNIWLWRKVCKKTSLFSTPSEFTESWHIGPIRNHLCLFTYSPVHSYHNFFIYFILSLLHFLFLKSSVRNVPELKEQKGKVNFSTFYSDWRNKWVNGFHKISDWLIFYKNIYTLKIWELLKEKDSLKFRFPFKVSATNCNSFSVKAKFIAPKQKLLFALNTFSVL